MTKHQNDPFFQVPRVRRKTTQGYVELPILYYDVSNVVAFFNSPLAQVKRMLEGTEFVPGLVVGDHALVGLSFYEYRDTTVGDYNEVGLAIPVFLKNQPHPNSGFLELLKKPDEQRLGFYILNLPVTTAMANAAGREFWGFPKFVTEIPFQLQDNKFSSAVMVPDSDEEILKLAGTLGPGIPAPPMSLALYSLLKGQMLRTLVNVRGRVKLCSAGSLRLQVNAHTDHEMAQNLRTLQLDKAKPLAVMATHRFQSRLNAGAPLIQG